LVKGAGDATRSPVGRKAERKGCGGGVDSENQAGQSGWTCVPSEVHPALASRRAKSKQGRSEGQWPTGAREREGGEESPRADAFSAEASKAKAESWAWSTLIRRIPRATCRVARDPDRTHAGVVRRRPRR
jgi:hypothetical protein